MNCEEQTPLTITRSNYEINLDENTPAEIMRERKKKLYAAMSAVDKQERIRKQKMRREANRQKKEDTCQ